MALKKTDTDKAPWYVIPADHKWYRNYAVARIVLETLEAMTPRLPEPSVDLKKIRAEYHKAVREAR